jgi:hypothetical protein
VIIDLHTGILLTICFNLAIGVGEAFTLISYVVCAHCSCPIRVACGKMRLWQILGKSHSALQAPRLPVPGGPAYIVASER